MADDLEFAMPLPIRTDYDASSVRAAARKSKDGAQARRLLSLAAIYEGATRTVWRSRCRRDPLCAEHGAWRISPGEIAYARVGHTGDVSQRQRSRLGQWLWDEFALSISKATLSREVRALGYRKLSARPRHHAQDQDAIENFKKGAS